MKALAILALCATVALGANSKAKVRVIDGKEVAPIGAVVTKPLFEVRDLKFYRCKVTDTGKNCTVASGSLVSNMAHKHWLVTVRISMFRNEWAPSDVGAMTVVVERPEPGKPVPFWAIGPPWSRGDAAENVGDNPKGEGGEQELRYSVSVTHSAPPKDDPAKF